MDEQTQLFTQIGRLEEKLSAINDKIETHALRDTEQHHELKSKLEKLYQLVDLTVKENNKKIDKNKEDLISLKRDRVWIVSLFGLFWGLIVFYIEWKIKGA